MFLTTLKFNQSKKMRRNKQTNFAATVMAKKQVRYGISQEGLQRMIKPIKITLRRLLWRGTKEDEIGSRKFEECLNKSGGRNVR